MLDYTILDLLGKKFPDHKVGFSVDKIGNELELNATIKEMFNEEEVKSFKVQGVANDNTEYLALQFELYSKITYALEPHKMEVSEELCNFKNCGLTKVS